MALLPPGLKGPAIVAGLLAGAWWLTKEPKKKKAAAKTAPPPAPPPQQPPSEPPARAPHHVAAGWTNWPRKDVFPTVRSLAQGFQLLGYGGWGTCIQTNGTDRWFDSPTCRGRIGAFQADFNAVMKLLGRSDRLDKDAKLGPSTIRGMVEALVLAGQTEQLSIECTPATGWPAGLEDMQRIQTCANSWQTLVMAAEQA